MQMQCPCGAALEAPDEDALVDAAQAQRRMGGQPRQPRQVIVAGVGVGRLDDPRGARITALDARAVMIGSKPSPDGAVPSVWIGDDTVAETLFSYLAALGHTRIAYVAGPAELEHTRLRAEVLERMAADASSASPCELDTIRCRPCDRAARSMPRISSEKNSPNRSGRMTPTVSVRLIDRLRAPLWGT